VEYVLVIISIPIVIFGLIYIAMIGNAAIELVKLFLAGLSGNKDTQTENSPSGHWFAWLFVGIIIVGIFLRVVGMDD